MNIKELKEIIKDLDDEMKVYIDAHDVYWPIYNIDLFDDELNKKSLAIQCRCNLGISMP